MNEYALRTIVIKLALFCSLTRANRTVVISTWPWPQVTEAAWEVLSSSTSTRSVLDAVQAGCARCEEDQCDGSVGYGGSPDENGETTLDAMIMDGATMNTGAVGAIRRIKNAIGVARSVLDHTSHTLLVGDLATQFAVENGFLEESLSTNKSLSDWNNWKAGNCQPNFRNNTSPDSKISCGPYTPVSQLSSRKSPSYGNSNNNNILHNHDTIGIVAMNKYGQTATGVSTNGRRYKVPGRVGDSPIPGAGSYADDTAGAAAATGNGDIMMRFLPSYQLVENMRQGMKPIDAAKDALVRILKKYPSFGGALIGVNIHGDYGAACTGFSQFQYCVRTENMSSTSIMTVKCTNMANVPVLSVFLMYVILLLSSIIS